VSRVRRPGSRRCATAVAVGVAAALLVACGGGGGSGEPDAPDETTPYPLEALLGGHELNAADDLRVEQLTAECMQELGWQYLPNEPADPVGAPAGSEEQIEPGTPEYGARFGYGVVRGYELGGYGVAERAGADTGPVDANEAWVGSLSETEREAYYEALYGDGAADPADPAAKGCANRAYEEVYPPTAADDAAILDRVIELQDRMDDDPTVRSAGEAWSRCMVDAVGPVEFAGQAVISPEEVQTAIESLLYEAMGAEAVAGEADQTRTDVIGSMTLSTGRGVTWYGTPAPIPPERLEDLRRREVDVWTADQRCQEESGLRAAYLAAERQAVAVLLTEFPQLATQAATR